MLAEEMKPADEAFPGVQALRRLSCSSLNLRQLELWRNSAQDAARDLVLQIEDVLDPAVKTVRPEMHAVRGVDELAGYAHPVAGPAHAALQHIAHPEFASHLLHVHVPPLVGKAGVAGDDEQPAQAGQGRQNILN